MNDGNKWKFAFARELTPLVFSALLVLFSACSGDDNGTDVSDKPVPAPAQAPVETLSTDFNDNVFSSTKEIELLKELQICDPKAPNDTDEKHPSCSPHFFRFFQLNKDMPLENGFILLVKAGVNDFPLRRVLIFEREKGKLVKLNGFNGNLIEKRPSASGFDDLVIRFSDNIEGSLCYYNCLFQWTTAGSSEANGGQYEYKYCEAIQEGGQESPHRIKAEYVDSMGIEIKKILDNNAMIF